MKTKISEITLRDDEVIYATVCGYKKGNELYRTRREAMQAFENMKER